FKEALYGGGFFHADLHSGNIMAELERDGQNKHYNMTLIDFGSAFRLSPDLQKAIISLLYAVNLRDQALIIESLKSIVTQPHTESLNQKLNTLVRDELTRARDEKASSLTLLNNIFSSVTDTHKISLPKEFIMFNRGRILLEQDLNSFV